MKEADLIKINRQRISPKIWDFSYFHLKNNLEVFRIFRGMLIKENKKTILDVGCGYKPWKLLLQEFEYIGMDIDSNYKPDIIGDAANIPMPENGFDGLIYSEVLEHVQNLDKVLKELKRVAKHDALVFISTPFVFPLHGGPYDYQRLTKFFFQEVFKNDQIILLKESNTSLSTPILSINLFLEIFLPYSFKIVKTTLYFFFNFLALIIEKITMALLKFVPHKYKDRFFTFPIGYALIVRIKK
jgi:ubiquinone/menaquinone biosynthesis C-methylase UbiE